MRWWSSNLGRDSRSFRLSSLIRLSYVYITSFLLHYSPPGLSKCPSLTPYSYLMPPALNPPPSVQGHLFPHHLLLLLSWSSVSSPCISSPPPLPLRPLSPTPSGWGPPSSLVFNIAPIPRLPPYLRKGMANGTGWLCEFLGWNRVWIPPTPLFLLIWSVHPPMSFILYLTKFCHWLGCIYFLVVSHPFLT